MVNDQDESQLQGKLLFLPFQRGGGPAGPQAWDPPRPGLQGPYGSLSKSGLGRKQLRNFGLANQAIPFYSFLLCEMGGIKKTHAAVRQAPGGGKRREEPGSWSWVGGAAAAACAKVAGGSSHGSVDRRTRAMAAAGSKRAFPEVFLTWSHGGLAPECPTL